jgi:predicted branched-subunit amino acid permease
MYPGMGCPQEERREAFLFGIFTSIGWFLGCAIGAIVGNILFLRSPLDGQRPWL